MATMFNDQRRLGIRLVADGTKMHNGLPVIGVREAGGGVLFVNNKRVLGVDIVAPGRAIHNEQPVRGAVLIADSRTVYNNFEVLAVFGAGSLDPELELSATAIDEGATTGRVVGALSVSNGSGPYTYSITADPDSKFAISGSNLVTSAALDYETKTSHNVTVEADNGVDDPVSQAFVIQVNNVIEGTLAPTTAAFETSASSGSVIATVTGLDAGANEVIASVTPNDGRLAFNDTQVLKGLSASSAGVINAVITTSAGRTLNMAITVTEAPEYSFKNFAALFDGGAVDGLMIDLTDKTTLFQDANGAAAVVNNGDPIGLALDHHKWGGKTLAEYRAAQPELLTNGTFDTDVSGWNLSASGALTWVSGKARLTTTGSSAFFHQSFSTVIGRWYELSADLSFISGATSITLYAGTSAGNGANLQSFVSGIAVHRRWFKATATTTFITVYHATSSTYTEWDNISIKEIDGHHATQATAANKPLWQSATNDVLFDGNDYLMTDYYANSSGNFLAAYHGVLATGSTRTLLGAYDNSPNGYAALFYTSAGLPRAIIGSGVNATGAASILTGGTLLGDQNSAATELFVNGVIAASVASPGDAPDAADAVPMFIGAQDGNGSPSLYASGTIKRIVAGQVRVQDTMTAADFHQNLIAA